MNNKTINWEKVIIYYDLKQDCKNYLFLSVTADNNDERKYWGQKFHTAYKKLKKMEAK